MNRFLLRTYQLLNMWNCLKLAFPRGKPGCFDRCPFLLSKYKESLDISILQVATCWFCQIQIKTNRDTKNHPRVLTGFLLRFRRFPEYPNLDSAPFFILAQNSFISNQHLVSSGGWGNGEAFY